MKYLIVDDHHGVRALIRDLITTPADEVRECGGGADALRAAREFQPEFVTMDVRLRDFDGITTTRALREICPAAQIVIVTAYDQPALREAAADAGAVSFVPKENLVELPPVIRRLGAKVASQARPKPDSSP